MAYSFKQKTSDNKSIVTAKRTFFKLLIFGAFHYFLAIFCDCILLYKLENYISVR
jgi:hypothetical protein